MGIVSGIVVYVIIWWVTLFMVLPFGIQSQAESSDPGKTLGTDPGAPVNPNLFKKVAVTSLIAAVFWLIVYFVIDFELISLRP